MTLSESRHLSISILDLIKSILLGLVILAAGAAIGASLMFMHLSRPPQPPAGEPELFAEQMLGRLGRELNLTPQQRRRLEPVLQQHHRTLTAIRAGVRPQIVRQLELLNADLAAVLTPEQMHLWEQKSRRLEERFPTFRGPRRGYGPEMRRRPGMEPQWSPDPAPGPAPYPPPPQPPVLRDPNAAAAPPPP